MNQQKLGLWLSALLLMCGLTACGGNQVPETTPVPDINTPAGISPLPNRENNSGTVHDRDGMIDDKDSGNRNRGDTDNSAVGDAVHDAEKELKKGKNAVERGVKDMTDDVKRNK